MDSVSVMHWRKVTRGFASTAQTKKFEPCPFFRDGSAYRGGESNALPFVDRSYRGHCGRRAG